MNICNKQVLTQIQMIAKHPKSAFTNISSSSYPINRDVFIPNTNLYLYSYIYDMMYIVLEQERGGIYLDKSSTVLVSFFHEKTPRGFRKCDSFKVPQFNRFTTRTIHNGGHLEF